MESIIAFAIIGLSFGFGQKLGHKAANNADKIVPAIVRSAEKSYKNVRASIENYRNERSVS